MKNSRNIKTVDLIEALRRCSTPGVHCDGDLAKFFAKKVMDQVALISIREGLQPIRGIRLKAMKEVYARTFFSWLRSPAEEGK